MAKNPGRKPEAAPEPEAAPATPFPAVPDTLHRKGDRLWIPLRQEWRDVAGKPEETVRQRFIRHLCDHYGYALDQMAQERRTTHGHRSPRADIVIWETPQARAANRTPVLVVECKAGNVDVDIRDYYQGESYTRAAGGELFIAHNARHTAVFRLVPGAPGEFVQINEIPRAMDWGDARRLDEIRKRLRAFNRREFQDLLFKCHSILRDVHKMDPGRAFDTISKVLFVKMYVERSGLHGTFTADFLDRRASTRLPSDPLVHDDLFERTKGYYRADDLFTGADRLDISEETFRRIVKELERFDLSKTGDDVKGLAFEKFLGSTFRGELGQFFTPRPVVDFMVNLLDPREGERICDPAAGSGGFLIRAFEHVRARVVVAVQAEEDRGCGRRSLVILRRFTGEDETWTSLRGWSSGSSSTRRAATPCWSRTSMRSSRSSPPAASCSGSRPWTARRRRAPPSTGSVRAGISRSCAAAAAGGERSRDRGWSIRSSPRPSCGPARSWSSAILLTTWRWAAPPAPSGARGRSG